MMTATIEGVMISMRGKTMEGTTGRGISVYTLRRAGAASEETVTLFMRKLGRKEYMNKETGTAMIGREMKEGMKMSNNLRRKKRKEMISLSLSNKFIKSTKT